MDANEFPSNSKSPQTRGEKKIDPIVVNEVVSRKKPLGKRLKELLIGGDSRTAWQYVFGEVIIPQAKDMLAEAMTQGFERLIYGDSRGSSRSYRRPGGPTVGRTNYTNYAQRGNNPVGRAMRDDHGPNASMRTRSTDEIIFATRPEAEAVLDKMYDLLNQYEMVSQADLHSMLKWPSTYTDQKWGWVDLKGSHIQRVNRGYALNLPQPESLD